MTTTVQTPVPERRAEARWTPRPVAGTEWIAAFMRTAFESAPPAQRQRLTRNLHRLIDETAAALDSGVSA